MAIAAVADAEIQLTNTDPLKDLSFMYPEVVSALEELISGREYPAASALEEPHSGQAYPAAQLSPRVSAIAITWTS